MIEGFDPVQWWIGWMMGLLRVHQPEMPVYGIDGHFKAYGGAEPIDKGYNTKRRIAERGIATVRLMDLHGYCWNDLPVAAGDALKAHVLHAARALAEAQRLDASRAGVRWCSPSIAVASTSRCSPLWRRRGSGFWRGSLRR